MKWLLLLLISQSGFSQPVVKKLDKKSIPFSYKGQIIDAVTWKDKFGEHYVVTTETGETPTKGSEDSHDALLIFTLNIKFSANSLLL